MENEVCGRLVSLSIILPLAIDLQYIFVKLSSFLEEAGTKVSELLSRKDWKEEDYVDKAPPPLMVGTSIFCNCLV